MASVVQFGPDTMKKVNVITAGLVLCFQLSASGCYGVETTEYTDPSLSYMFRHEGESTDLSIALRSEVGPFTVLYGGSEHPFQKLSIEKAELADIVTLFPLANSTIIPVGLPNCDAEPITCLAVTATEGAEVFGYLDLGMGPSSFYFKSPPNLPTKAAQLIVALEELRQRVIAEGELISPPTE